MTDYFTLKEYHTSSRIIDKMIAYLSDRTKRNWEFNFDQMTEILYFFSGLLRSSNASLFILSASPSREMLYLSKYAADVTSDCDRTSMSGAKIFAIGVSERLYS